MGKKGPRHEGDSHDEGVAERADKEERDRDERRREVVVTRGVQAVGAFADKDGAFLRAAIRVSLEKKRGLERESQPRGKRECRQRSSKGGQQVSTASGTNRKERTTHESEEGDRKERDGEAVVEFVGRVAEMHPNRSEHESHAHLVASKRVSINSLNLTRIEESGRQLTYIATVVSKKSQYQLP